MMRQLSRKFSKRSLFQQHIDEEDECCESTIDRLSSPLQLDGRSNHSTTSSNRRNYSSTQHESDAERLQAVGTSRPGLLDVITSLPQHYTSQRFCKMEGVSEEYTCMDESCTEIEADDDHEHHQDESNPPSARRQNSASSGGMSSSLDEFFSNKNCASAAARPAESRYDSCQLSLVMTDDEESSHISDIVESSISHCGEASSSSMDEESSSNYEDDTCRHTVWIERGASRHIEFVIPTTTTDLLGPSIKSVIA